MQYVRGIKQLNPHLICILCGGYLINATTLIECSHSFCKTCIVQYLETSFNCPVCETEVHKTKPLANIRSDPTLQELIYKLVPGLYKKEKKARQVYELNREKERWNQPGGSSEKDPVLEDYTRILVTLTYFKRKRPRAVRNDRVTSLFPTRFLCCPLNLPVRVMKKFILKKFDLPLHWDIDVWRTDEALLDDLTLDDIVRIYGIFRERKPLEISFSVTPKDAELFQGDSITLNKTVQFDLKKESNAASTIAARNILTTTPDPSDDEEGKDNKEKKTKDDNVMDVDKEENDDANSGLNSSSLAEIHVTS